MKEIKGVRYFFCSVLPFHRHPEAVNFTDCLGELDNLKSQIVTSSLVKRRNPPRAFVEQEKQAIGSQLFATSLFFSHEKA
jgi:hypothetical protein